MKLRSWCTTSLVILFAVTGVQAVPNTYLVNGDFETGDLTGWTVSGTGTAEVTTTQFNTNSALAVLNGTAGITQAFEFREGGDVYLDFAQVLAPDVADPDKVVTEPNDAILIEIEVQVVDPVAGIVPLYDAQYLESNYFDPNQGPFDPNMPMEFAVNPPGAIIAGYRELRFYDFSDFSVEVSPGLATIGDSVGPISIEAGAFPFNEDFTSASSGVRLHFQARREFLPDLPDEFIVEIRIRNTDADNFLVRTAIFDNAATGIPPRISHSLTLPETGEPVSCDTAFDWARDKPLEFNVSAGDNSASPPSLTVQGLPPGATFLPGGFGPPELNLRRFSWTPVEGQEGEHVIVFTSQNDLGTTTCTLTVNVEYDRDGDSLPDLWELDGYTPPGGVFVDLPALGANVAHKDLFVYADYFENAEYSHKPPDLTPIVEAFAAAPVQNPDGTPGITLHAFVSPYPASVRPADGAADPFVVNLGAGTGISDYRWTRPADDISDTVFFDDIKNGDASRGIARHFPPDLQCSTRYCLFAHGIAELRESGIARGQPSSDFIVSLGAFIDENDPTPRKPPLALALGTFMHELGHGLGLQHGGGDTTNFKPNYLSVMNYSFQRGLRKGGAALFDFSRLALPDLVETDLDEPAGVQDWPAEATGFETTWFKGIGEVAVQQWTPPFSPLLAAAIDWNQNNDDAENPVSASVNRDIARATLTGFDDWSHISFGGGTVGGGVAAPLPEQTPLGELDVETAKQIRPAPVLGLAVRAGRGSARLAWNPGGVTGDVIYRVFRKLQGAATFTEIGTTQAALYSDRGLVSGQTYVYTVTMVDGLGIESAEATPVTVRVR